MNPDYYLATALCLFLTACSKPYDPIVHYDLEITDDALELAEKSIERTNMLLASPELPEFYLYDGSIKKEGVAVLWVGDRNLSQSVTDMMFVLRECACVVVQPMVFMSWINNYETVGDPDARYSSSGSILSYLLLHELGHIQQGHTGRAISIPSGYYNRDNNDEKKKEQDADNFAANVIHDYLGKDELFDTWLSAANIQMSLSSLAFYLQGKRLIDNSGCSALDAPCAFHDIGDTHHNFEYRILKANCRLDSNACSILDTYKRRRNSDGVFPGGIIYRAPESG